MRLPIAYNDKYYIVYCFIHSWWRCWWFCYCCLSVFTWCFVVTACTFFDMQWRSGITIDVCRRLCDHTCWYHAVYTDVLHSIVACVFYSIASAAAVSYDITDVATIIRDSSSSIIRSRCTSRTTFTCWCVLVCFDDVSCVIVFICLFSSGYKNVLINS